jgi:hypothetical protein
MSKQSNLNNPNVNFRFSNEDLRIIQTIARITGITNRTDIIRMALREVLDRLNRQHIENSTHSIEK